MALAYPSMAPRSSAPLTGTPSRSKPSRTRPVGGPLQCSVSTRRQWSRSASRIATTYESRDGQRRSANWVTRWSYEAAHFCSAPVSQSDQCTRVPPRSKMTARGAVTVGNDTEPREGGGVDVRSLLALLAVHPRSVLHPALSEADARGAPRPRVPRVRAKARHPAHLDDPSARDDVVPRVPHRALHRYRGLRADTPRHPADAPGSRDRSPPPHTGRSRARRRADRLRAEAAQGQGDG